MRTCVSCGERNPDRARFCMTCATPLDLTPAVDRRKVDAAVGAFGVPWIREDDAVRACRAAIGLRDAVEDFNAE